MIRKAKGWTLKHSDATGVSVATLSKIENDQAGLSFGTVLKIVSSLGMTFEELLSPGAGEGGRGRRAINRAGSGVRLATSQYDYEVFATELVAKRMVPLITRVKARTIADFPHLLGHAGEEWNYVLKGAIEIHTEYYAPVILRQGDSIYIDSGMGHASISIGEEDAELLSVVFGQETPPLPQARTHPPAYERRAPPRAPPAERGQGKARPRGTSARGNFQKNAMLFLLVLQQ
jgi:transcriptional regulator with XRE-family HTH domain